MMVTDEANRMDSKSSGAFAKNKSSQVTDGEYLFQFLL